MGAEVRAAPLPLPASGALEHQGQTSGEHGEGKAVVVEEKQSGRGREVVLPLALGANDSLSPRKFGEGGAEKGECLCVDVCVCATGQIVHMCHRGAELYTGA